jgi:gas vesicle protein
MRSGNYEASEGGGAGTAITFLLIGLGAGALVGLLFAPKTGRRMRKELFRRYQDARSTIDDWKDEIRDVAEDVVERGTEFADDLRERVTPLTRNIRR